MNRRDRLTSSRPRSGLSLTEAEALLETLPLPTLLLETRPACLLAANTAAAGLSAYSRFELLDLPLAALFPLEENLLPETETPRAYRGAPPRKAVLARRGGGHTTVWLNFTLLEEGGRALLTMEADLQRQQRIADENRRQRLHQIMGQISSVTPPADLDAALKLALHIGQTLSGAALLAVYRAEGDQPALGRAAVLGEAGKLPERLSAEDLAALQAPALWVPGKRLPLDIHPMTTLRGMTSIHRAAQEAGFSYVASAPIGGAPPALAGLLVLAGKDLPPGNDTLLSAQAISAHIAAILHQYTLTTNLSLAAQKQGRALAVCRAVTENVQDGVILASPELRIVEMNPGAEQMLGYANAEVVGERLENILVGAEDQLLTLTETRPHDLGSLNLYRRDGRAFQSLVRCLPLRPEAEESLDFWAILLHDQSQQEAYRLRTQQLEQRALLGEVTAVFAHEVRNPINNISTGLQLMALDLPAESPHVAVIGRLQQDCDRLAELMKSVLAFARPKEYQFEAVDAAELLGRLVERWRPRLARAQVQYRLDAPAGRSLISADPRALEQVLNNLIGNAVQAMTPEDGGNGGMLTLRARLAPQDADSPAVAPLVEISISDNGPGIPEEIRERIFEPFFTTKRSGTGLGLAITKQIVTAHRGSLQVISIPGGTAFVVRLPALSKDQP